MKLISFDIESAPLPDAEERILKLYPFNPDKVALGNAKKPDTVERIIEEARENHIPKLMEKAQLDPALSYICAFGMFNPDDGYSIWTAKEAADEPDCLLNFSAMLGGQTREAMRFMGWNCDRFDLPFLLKRFWITKAPVNPAMLNKFGKGFADNFVDLMKVYTCWQYNEFAPLTQTAKTLDCMHPDRVEADSGKDFWKWLAMDPKKAEAYFKSDLYETYYVGRRLLDHQLVYSS